MSQMSCTGKIVRLVIGIAIIGLGIFYQNWWGALGVVPILGALTGKCPLCSIFSKSKCGTPKPGDEKSHDQKTCCGH
ncbi:MAG: DUF2892 domain-containing protein [Candidatus Omnitrophica bacterium]|nr:DUF2892 domain-containing protein [Candidatus Omnitrophota bacterium]